MSNFDQIAIANERIEGWVPGARPGVQATKFGCGKGRHNEHSIFAVEREFAAECHF